MWLDGEDCDKALWHANAILKLSKLKTVLRPTQASENTRSEKKKERPPEAPHVPISICVATLTVWAQSICQKPANLATGLSALDSGISILTYLRVGSAK